MELEYLYLLEALHVCVCLCVFSSQRYVKRKNACLTLNSEQTSSQIVGTLPGKTYRFSTKAHELHSQAILIQR